MAMKIQDITQVELSTKEPSDASHVYVEEDGVFRRHSLDAMKLAVQPDVEKEARQYADNAAASAKAASTSETNAEASATASAASETAAAASATAASTSETQAKVYMDSASASKTAAANSAANASESATKAETAATNTYTYLTSAQEAATNAEKYKDEAFTVTPTGYEAVAIYATQGVIIDDDGLFYALVEEG